MNNYLLQILKETKTIIIPGLGALTVTNEATGEIMFMSFLKHDDGNLAAYISEKEGIDLNDATNLIAKFVREVMAELDKGETYDMYQFGKFQKVAGEVEFVQWESGSAVSAPEETPVADDTSTSSVTEEIGVVPVVEEVIPEPEIVPEPEPIAEEVVPVVDTSTSSVTEEQEIVPEPIKEVVTEEPAPVVETVVVPPVVTPTPEPKVNKNDLRKPVAKSPKEKLKAADKQKADKPKKKTSVLAYILWGFVVLVLGAGTYVAVQFDTLKKDFPILADLAGENEPEKDTTSLKSIGESDPSAHPDSMPEAEPIPGSEVNEQEPAVEETPAPVQEKPKPEPKPVKKAEPKPAKKTPKPAPKPVKKQEPVVKPIPKPQPKPVSRPQTVSVYKPKPANFPTPNMSKPYHIIAGSFSSNLNARNFATKLKGMGMTNLSIGEKDGLYKVSINGYNSEEEAKAAVPSVQGIAPGAWVFKWN